MIDLRPKDRDKIIAFARQHLPKGAIVWVFGSRVRDTAHATSDVDLVIKEPAQGELDPSAVLNFREALQDSTLPLLVQVFVWKQLPTGFQQNILKAYEVLVEVR